MRTLNNLSCWRLAILIPKIYWIVFRENYLIRPMRGGTLTVNLNTLKVTLEPEK
jgi:hypothetical protein